MKDIHPEVLKAHQRAKETSSRVAQEGDEFTKAPPKIRAVASRAERTLGKKIKQHYPNISLQEDVELRKALQEHEKPEWKQT